MTEPDKINACMEQAKLAYIKHNDRRAYEWKVTLGLWAVILASIIQKVSLPFWGWSIIVGCYGFFWLAPLWTANKNDKLWHDHYINLAAKLLQNPNHKIDYPPERIAGIKRYYGFITDWSLFFQFLTTAGLALAAYFLS